MWHCSTFNLIFSDQYHNFLGTQRRTQDKRVLANKKMEKINKITTDGNNNIVLQDITGNDITINVNDTKSIEKLIAGNSDKINEILDLLKQSQEPTLKRFAEIISKIQVVENRTSRYVKYVLLFFALPAAFVFLLYWYFVLSKPFGMTVSVKETHTIPSLPFTEGIITLQYADKTENQTTSGEVIFKQIPANLKNKEAKIVFKAKGYNTIDSNIVLNDLIVLPIHRDNSLELIFGIVKDENNIPVSDVQITVLDISEKTNDAGEFSIHIPFEKQQAEQRLTAYKKGFQRWEYTFPVIKNVETKIILKK